MTYLRPPAEFMAEMMRFKLDWSLSQFSAQTLHRHTAPVQRVNCGFVHVNYFLAKFACSPLGWPIHQTDLGSPYQMGDAAGGSRSGCGCVRGCVEDVSFRQAV